MTAHTEAQIRHVYEEWHAATVARNLEGLLALYAEDAIFESPLVLAALREKTDGVLRGKAAIRPFFDTWLNHRQSGLGRWYRTGVFFCNGRQLVWEYPRDTPQGDQVDLAEFIDLADGLIAHHRVYWGWKGFQALSASLSKPAG